MNKSLGTGSIDRSARVRRIKRVIVGLIITAVFLPSVLCMILFMKIGNLEKQITELTYQKEIVNVVTESTRVNEPNKADLTDNPEILDIKKEELAIEEALPEQNNSEDSESELPADEEQAVETPVDAEVAMDSQNEEASEAVNLKRVYLTFDDGPSSNTARILDILKQYDVKATFFVVGRLSETTTPMYRRIVDEGHTIGMHSYTHKYSEIYANADAFVYDLERIQSLIYEQTGVLSRVYRFPGGSSNTVSHTDVEVLKNELAKRDIRYYDWNVVSGDASSRYGLPKDDIVRNCTVKVINEEEAIILMHDLPEKATTVEALPEIIEYYQSLGVEILPIDENTTQMHQK